MTETATPASLAEIHARYREIAPEPDPASPEVAGQLARKLLVNAMRQSARNTAAIIAGSLPAEGFDALCAGFAAVHLMNRYAGNLRPAAAEIAGALLGGGDMDELLYDHALTLGVDPEEVTRLAEAEIALKAKDGESDKARADRLQRACETLGKGIGYLSTAMYAARIEIIRGDHKAACEWVLNSMDGIGDYEPGGGWDGSETAQEWLDRDRASDEFNEGRPVRIVSRPGPDIRIGGTVLTPSPTRADVVCAVPVLDSTCGRPLTEGPCTVDHDQTEVDGQASLFDPAGNAEGQS